jgi:hypothetical protein
VNMFRDGSIRRPSVCILRAQICSTHFDEVCYRGSTSELCHELILVLSGNP